MRNLKCLFTALLLLCSLTATANNFEVDGINYNILSENDKTVKVIYKGEFYNEYTGNVVIPECVTYNGTTYTVTSIGFQAFRDCFGLTSITIPNSVTSIEEDAFYGCTGLTSITIPNSVTSIGENAFSGCTGLKSVVNFSNLTFRKGSTDYCDVAYYADKVYNAPNGSIEGDFIFGKPNGVNTLLGYLGYDAELTLPADYKGGNYIIGSSVFSGCSGFTSIEIPNSVTSIGWNAFSGCTSLTSIEIPNSVTRIEQNAFSGCTGLKSVVVGNSVTSIEYYAFSGCTSLTSITIPNSVTSIRDGAFLGCSGITSVEIPNSVTSIGDYAFASCDKITEIKVDAETPVKCNANIFSNVVYDKATLHIPIGTKTLYGESEPWYLFFNIKEMDFTGVEDVKGENEELKGVYYDLSGRQVENPTKGIYIINGKKVIVK